MVRGILAFNKGARDLLEQDGNYQYTVKQFLEKNKINSLTFEKFIIPMASAIWSSPPERISYFPIRYLARFYRNHGLLSINDHPQWRVIKGGSKEYVNRMVSRFSDSIKINSKVVGITRTNEGIKLKTKSGDVVKFDAVIMACHSDQSLKILTDPTPDEVQILSLIPYQKNMALLHTDSSVLPRRKRIWASWNSNIPIKKEDLVSLT